MISNYEEIPTIGTKHIIGAQNSSAMCARKVLGKVSDEGNAGNLLGNTPFSDHIRCLENVLFFLLKFGNNK